MLKVLNKKYEKLHIFNLPLNILIEHVFSNNLYFLFDDEIFCKYIIENLKNIDFKYLLKILSLESVTQYIRMVDLLDFFYLLNDEEKITLLNLTHIQKFFFKKHFLSYKKLDLGFSSLESYKILLKMFPDEEKRAIILRGVKDEDFVFSYLKSHKFSEVYLFSIVSKFSEDEHIIPFLNLFNSSHKSFLISKLHSEEYKKAHFDELSLSEQLKFIFTKDDTVKCKFIEEGFYPEFIIPSLNDLNKLFSYFLRLKDYDKQLIVLQKVKNDNIKFGLFQVMNLENHYIEVLLYLYSTVTDSEIRKKIKDLIADKGIIEAIKSNDKNPKILTNDIEFSQTAFVDERITIGIEIECTNSYNDAYIAIKKLLSKWDIKEEATVINGVEITSPVLNYNLKSLKELKYVCLFLQRNNFVVNESCGGHIHIGFDYFEDITNLQLFYYLYVHCEDAISLMINRCGSKIRTCALTNARPIKDMMINAYGKYMSFTHLSITQFVSQMKELQHDRYTSVNLDNALSPQKNTIEFRIPNAEIDFDELNYNIIFITRLIYIAKNLPLESLDEKTLQKIMSLSSDIPLCDKRDILLDLMFNEIDLKNIYFDRFESNLELNKEFSQKL